MSKVKAKTQFVSSDSLLSEVLSEYPYLAEILVKDYGLHCVSCFANVFDTMESGAKVHGMTDEEIQGMLEHLNKEIKQK